MPLITEKNESKPDIALPMKNQGPRLVATTSNMDEDPSPDALITASKVSGTLDPKEEPSAVESSSFLLSIHAQPDMSAVHSDPAKPSSHPRTISPFDASAARPSLIPVQPGTSVDQSDLTKLTPHPRTISPINVPLPAFRPGSVEVLIPPMSEPSNVDFVAYTRSGMYLRPVDRKPSTK